MVANFVGLSGYLSGVKPAGPSRECSRLIATVGERQVTLIACFALI
jgi:hypothetical protein